MTILVRFTLVNKEITPWYNFYSQEGANRFIEMFRKNFKVLKVEKRVINNNQSDLYEIINGDDTIKEVQ